MIGDTLDPNDDWFTQNAPPVPPTFTNTSTVPTTGPAQQPYGPNNPYPVPVNTATYGPSGPAAPASYNYQQALAKVQGAIGRNLSQAEISGLFQQFGGDQNSTFTDAGLAPVIASMKGAQFSNPDNTPGMRTVMGDGPGGVDGFGNPISQYSSNPNAPTPPGAQTQLAPYAAPVWQGGAAPTATRLAQYRPPTLEELQNSPGYKARQAAADQGFERSAAARGTILNGGTIKARDRFDQEFASNEYGNLVGQGQNTTQLNNAATQGDNANAYTTYLQNYGQFTDAANLGLGARQQNVSENNTAFGQGQVNYGNRYTQYLDQNNRSLQDYLTNQATRRNSEQDYWGRLMDLNNTGANAANNSYRFQAFA